MPPTRLALAVPLVLLVAACSPGTDTTSPTRTAEPSVVMDSVVAADSTLRFTASLVYSQLRDAGPHTDALNAALADSARAYVERFRPDAAPPPGCLTCAAEVEGTTQVTLLTDRLFSALTEAYWYTGGAHGNTDLLPITLDLTTGRPVALADLFAPEAAYLDTLSALTRASLERQAARHGMKPGDFWEAGTAPEADRFARFTLGPDSLTIHFPPYQVAPYAAGTFATPLAYARLGAVLAPGGPASSLAGE